MFTRVFVLLSAASIVLGASSVAPAAAVMYGGLGGHGPGSTSTNDGSLVTINELTGAVSLVGHPAGVARLTGIAFDRSGALFGSTVGGIPFPPPPQPSTSTLIRINPDTGALASTIGPITDGPGGAAISISDLAAQPGTGTLFGVRAPLNGMTGLGDIFTIDKATGVATRIGSTGHFFDSLAFGPTGTMYVTAADLAPMGGEANPLLLTIDPANAHVLSSVKTSAFYGALGVRPSDGQLFAGNGDGGQIFTLDATTGAATALPQTTGTNFVGDLDFRPAPATAIPLPPALLPGLATLLAAAATARSFGRSCRS